MKIFWVLLGVALLFTSCVPKEKHAERNIKALGYGSISFYPNFAEMSLEVAFTRDKMKDAVSEVQAEVGNVLRMSNKFVADKKDIRISNISTSKDFEYIGNKEKFIGYKSSQSITIKITNLKLLEGFMEEILKTRISRIQNIHYSHTQADSLRREANILALKNALKTARKIAASINAKLGPVQEISNYKNLNEDADNIESEQGFDMELYGKGIGGRGFKLTPELLRYNSISHVMVSLE